MIDRIQYLLYTVAFSAAVLLFFGSCGEKGPRAEDVTVTDVQILAFKLSVRNNPNVAKCFFSIDNKTGKIYNTVPLPFGTELDSAALDISMFKANTVRVAVGDGELHDWTPRDSVWIKGNDRLRLEVTSFHNKTITKIYTVIIDTYKFDPLTFVWQPIPGCNLPAEQTYSPQWAFTRDDRVLLFRQAALPKIYTATIQDPGQWSEASLTGLTGTLLNMCKDADEMLWAQTADDKTDRLLHSADGLTWTEVTAADLPAHFQLLGVLGRQGSEKTLCLATGREGTADYAPSTRLFATVQAGKFTRRENVPMSFRIRYASAVPAMSYNMAVLRILGGVASDGGRMQPDLWYTSNGHDWLQPFSNSTGHLPTNDEGPGALVTIGARAYYYPRVQNDAATPAVFYTTDYGQNWQAGKRAVMMPPEATFGLSADFSFADKQGNIYMGSSVSSQISGGSCLWRGRLKLDEK